ncbi:MAG: hypothetical protein KDA61_16480, partial [Planctomycetales bacterium]|nr:hypothetical protein [Planctomycetales bacterium]
ALDNRVVLLGTAIAALLVSLPLPWLTISTNSMTLPDPSVTAHGRLGPGPTRLPLPDFMNFKLTATGLNGSIRLGDSVPIWLLVTIATVATSLAIANTRGVTAVPRKALIGVLGVVGLFFGAAIVAVASGEATAGVGLLLACVALAVAMFQIASTPSVDT